MTVISKQALVNHSAEKMFDLINDVQHYPDFIPWCASAIIHAENDSMIDATLAVAKAGLSYQFRTRNHKRRPTRMDMQLIEGPFSKFHATWEIKPLSESACKVHYQMSYDFSNKLASLALNKVFSHIAETMVDIFVKRAAQLYG